mmetsp:Transcript_12220/g.14202  ORF Transcript_12220/g.14202 Transcript_12220/m.14202 type:complete len:160 (+) Transcript_12220:115-594(+)
MVEDVFHGLDWVQSNIGAYGGDPENIFLLGQSAGAHLGMLSVLVNAVCYRNLKANKELNFVPNFKPSKIRAFVGISGPYDMIKFGPHFHERGLGPEILNSVFGCRSGASDKEINEHLQCLSPTKIFQSNLLPPGTVELIPPLIFCHGKVDKVSRSNSSY